MSNPVLEALVHHRVADIVDPPRAWKSDMKAAFLRLPRNLQIYFADHEKRREAAIHEAHQGRAAAVKKLAATQDRLDRAEEKLKRIENVESKSAAVA